MPKIFESPDGGRTIYSREFGGYTREVESGSLIDDLRDQKLWGDIRRAAKTNPLLQEALDRVKVIYELSRKDYGKK